MTYVFDKGAFYKNIFKILDYISSKCWRKRWLLVCITLEVWSVVVVVITNATNLLLNCSGFHERESEL